MPISDICLSSGSIIIKVYYFFIWMNSRNIIYDTKRIFPHFLQETVSLQTKPKIFIRQNLFLRDPQHQRFLVISQVSQSSYTCVCPPHPFPPPLTPTPFSPLLPPVPPATNLSLSQQDNIVIKNGRRRILPHDGGRPRTLGASASSRFSSSCFTRTAIRT